MVESVEPFQAHLHIDSVRGLHRQHQRTGGRVHVQQSPGGSVEVQLELLRHLLKVDALLFRTRAGPASLHLLEVLEDAVTGAREPFDHVGQ
eukprot:11926835-Prorocentrum_lima.AAC.1